LPVGALWQRNSLQLRNAPFLLRHPGDALIYGGPPGHLPAPAAEHALPDPGIRSRRRSPGPAFRFLLGDVGIPLLLCDGARGDDETVFPAGRHGPATARTPAGHVRY